MKLIIKHLGKVTLELQLEEGHEYSIGRGKDCDVVLEDQSISRKHLKIYQSSESGYWTIEVLSELGELYLEGEEVGGVELEHPAIVSLKNYIFEFTKEEEPVEEEVAEEEEQHSQNLPVNQNLSDDFASDEEATSASGSTKIHQDDSLVHSLHISVKDESSEYVNLQSGDSWILGRSEECDIYIDYNILSRKHLHFKRIGNIFTVTDLGGSNTTSLNGKDLTPNKEYPLNSDDRLEVGNLSIVFEIRDKNFQASLDNLPAIATQDESNNNLPAAMPIPKIILEESNHEEDTSSKKKFFNKKRIIFFIIIGAFLAGLFFMLSQEDKKQETVEDTKQEEQSNKIKETYQLAQQFLQQQKFQFCIDEIKKLHQITPYYLDSQQMLTQCGTAQENQRKQLEFEENEKKKQETEEKIAQLANECKKKEDTFTDVSDLSACANEVLQLDPSNAIINAIKLRIEERDTLQKLKQEKKDSYRQMIQSKKYLYNKAKKIHDQNKPLKAVAAYKRFLRSAKGVSGVSGLYKKAEQSILELQTNYDNTLNGFYKDCEDLIKNKKFKEAYPKCKAILGFKRDDPLAYKYMNLATVTLQDSLKASYQQSMLYESLSKVDEAQKIWKEILEKDLPHGHYYKKAKSLLDKYD